MILDQEPTTGSRKLKEASIANPNDLDRMRFCTQLKGAAFLPGAHCTHDSCIQKSPDA